MACMLVMTVLHFIMHVDAEIVYIYVPHTVTNCGTNMHSYSLA